jgi:hypothetical protein
VKKKNPNFGQKKKKKKKMSKQSRTKKKKAMWVFFFFLAVLTTATCSHPVSRLAPELAVSTVGSLLRAVAGSLPAGPGPGLRGDAVSRAATTFDVVPLTPFSWLMLEVRAKDATGSVDVSLATPLPGQGRLMSHGCCTHNRSASSMRSECAAAPAPHIVRRGGDNGAKPPLCPWSAGEGGRGGSTGSAAPPPPRCRALVGQCKDADCGAPNNATTTRATGLLDFLSFLDDELAPEDVSMRRALLDDAASGVWWRRYRNLESVVNSAAGDPKLWDQMGLEIDAAPGDALPVPSAFLRCDLWRKRPGSDSWKAEVLWQDGTAKIMAELNSIYAVMTATPATDDDSDDVDPHPTINPTSGRDIPHELRVRLSKLIREVPVGGKLNYVGLWFGRGAMATTGIRLVVQLTTSADVVRRYLDAIGYAHTHKIMPMLEDVANMMHPDTKDFFAVAPDIWHDAHDRIGFEIFISGAVNETGNGTTDTIRVTEHVREAALLDFFEERELISAEAADNLRPYFRGRHFEVCVKGARAGGDAALARLILIHSHFKLVFKPAKGWELKVYTYLDRRCQSVLLP